MLGSPVVGATQVSDIAREVIVAPSIHLQQPSCDGLYLQAQCGILYFQRGIALPWTDIDQGLEFHLAIRRIPICTPDILPSPKTHILISRREVKNKGDVDVFDIERPTWAKLAPVLWGKRPSSGVDLPL
jgi:hypothetical protein